MVLFFTLGLPLLSLSRLGLGIWQAERINTAEIGWATFFLQGVRSDIILLSIFSVPLLILIPVLATRWTWPTYRSLSYCWLLLSITVLVFMEASTPSFIMQYDLRPNRLFVEYLRYPREVLAAHLEWISCPFAGGGGRFSPPFLRGWNGELFLAKGGAEVVLSQVALLVPACWFHALCRHSIHGRSSCGESRPLCGYRRSSGQRTDYQLKLVGLACDP